MQDTLPQLLEQVQDHSQLVVKRLNLSQILLLSLIYHD